MSEPAIELTDPDDAKLLTLARSARARTAAAQGAAVRDTMGRTYAAATVSLPSLQLTAVGAAVATAIAGGSTGLEAVVVVGGELVAGDLAVVAEFAGAGVPLYLA